MQVHHLHVPATVFELKIQHTVTPSKNIVCDEAHDADGDDDDGEGEEKREEERFCEGSILLKGHCLSIWVSLLPAYCMFD